MKRFVPGPGPHLNRPYWRFRIDTAEPDGQYELLLKAEQDGAETYYVPPKFHDWEAYLEAYGDCAVIDSSLLMAPSCIRTVLDDNGVADGPHKVVYDHGRAYVCSDPLPLTVTRSRDFAKRLRTRIEKDDVPLGQSMRRVLSGFSERVAVRRQAEAQAPLGADADRQPLVPRHWDRDRSSERRHAGAGAGDGQPCLAGTTKLDDRRGDKITQDAVERIRIE